MGHIDTADHVTGKRTELSWHNNAEYASRYKMLQTPSKSN